MKIPATPVHPGALLRQYYLDALHMSAQELATHLHVPVYEIEEILNQQRAISADMAARFARYFGGDAHSWLMVQADYELSTLPNHEAITLQISPLFSGD